MNSQTYCGSLSHYDSIAKCFDVEKIFGTSQMLLFYGTNHSDFKWFDKPAVYIVLVADDASMVLRPIKYVLEDECAPLSSSSCPRLA